MKRVRTGHVSGEGHVRRWRVRPRVVLALGAGGLLIGPLLSACGGAAAAAGAKGVPAESAEKPAESAEEPTEGTTPLEALERDLDMSERFLTAQLMHLESRQAVTSSEVQGPAPVSEEERDAAEAPARRAAPKSGRPTAPAPAPAPSQPGQEAASPSGAAPPVVAAEGSPCALACNALRSMRRSTDGICRLTGGESERCASARSRLTAAEDRVERAGCRCHE